MLYQCLQIKKKKFSVLQILFPWGYTGKKYKLLLSTFKNNSTPLKQEINELLKTHPSNLFNFDYLKQYWVFNNE